MTSTRFRLGPSRLAGQPSRLALEDPLPGAKDFGELSEVVEPTYGHTPGHVLVSISSGDQQAYNISDVVVHPLFVEHPEWSSGIDMDAGQADQARRQFFARAAEEKALVFGHHLGPFPNLGHIVARGEAWQWQPIETGG